MTRIDPLFVVLSLPCAQRLDVFQPFRDYTVYTAASHDCESVDVDMTGLVTDEQLSLVCETKNALGETYYRVTEEKVMQWLLTKLCKLNETKESTTNDDKVIVQQQQQQQEKIVAIRDRRHAIDLIAHYLSDDWAIKFKHAVGFITNTENGKNANGLQQHEDNGEIPTMQTQGIAADLAMSVMLADAQTNNDGFDTTQYQQQQSTPTGRKQPSRKPMVSSNVSANAKKFWAAQSGKKDKDGNVKAKTTSGTKGKTSATGGNVNAKRKRSGK